MHAKTCMHYLFCCFQIVSQFAKMSKRSSSIFDLECGCSDVSEDESFVFSQSDLDFIADEGDAESEDEVELRPSRRRRIEDGSDDEEEEAQEGVAPEREATEDFDALLELTPGSLQDILGVVEPTPPPPYEANETGRKRATRFAMTLNNPTEAEEEAFRSKLGEMTKFRLFGRENFGLPGKTPHLQCYIECSRNYSISALQKALTKCQGFASRYSVQICGGNAKQNIDYCSKDGDVFQSGTFPAGQGKRSDLDAVVEELTEGKSVHAIALANPNQFIKYHAGINRLFDEHRNVQRQSVTLGYWIFGDTGVGKSRWAHSLSPESTYVKEPNSKWWDGYAGEETVVIDDYRPSAGLGFSTLLHLADRYAHVVEKKGSMCQFNSKRLVITSPLNIDQTFAQLDWMNEGKINQLKRRFVELEFGVGKLNHLLKLCDVVHENADEEEEAVV